MRIRVRTWYKILKEFSGDVEKTCNKLGLEEKFFKVVGMTNPLERRRYHEVTYYQKVWILKSLCDWCLVRKQKTVLISLYITCFFLFTYLLIIFKMHFVSKG